MKKKVLIVGSGGREHALAWKLAQSPKVGALYVAPGNGGTAKIAENVPTRDQNELAGWTLSNKIDITIVGPDNALSDGIVDLFQEKGLKIFGPTQKAAEIESSKSFAKKLMKANNIPTAEFEVFNDYNEALTYLKSKGAPIVVKASGLALGKGVYVCRKLDEAENALKEIMIDNKFGDAGSEVVIEEFLEGQEVSFHAFCDGKTATLFPTTQDHKTIFENDKGPNTGGMGTFGPVPWVTKEMINKVKEKVVESTLAGMAKIGRPYVGILYPGLIMTNNGPKVLEFNARFGDPETQSYMRLLESDIYDIIEACVDGKLSEIEICWSKKSAICVVLASEGYPEEYVKDVEIKGINEAEKIPGVVVFHAGTKVGDKKLMTAGGRVLGVTAIGDNLKEAQKNAYEAVDKIKFEGMQFRRDIGAKVL